MALHDRRDSAIDNISATGDELGLRSGQKRGYRGDVLGFAAAANGAAFNIALDFFGIRFVPFARNVGSDIARHHGVDRNTVRTQNRGNRFHHGIYAAFSGAVVDLGGRSNIGRDRTDADDAAASASGEHDPGRFLAGEERGPEIDIVHAVPQLLGDVEQLQHGTDACVVDQNIQLAPFAHIPEHGSDSGRVGYIGFPDFTIAAGLAHQAERLPGRARILGIGRRSVIDHHVSPFASQTDRDGPSNAARGACDYRGLSFKTPVCRAHDSGCTTINKVHSIKTYPLPYSQDPGTFMPLPVSIPKATVAMEEANILAWRKQPGEAVVKDEILFEMETDKVVVEVPAPASGTLLRIDVVEGTAKLDRPIAWIGEPGEAIPETAAARETAKPSSLSLTAPNTTPARAAATPAARRRAREVNMDLALVRGTGPGGRITQADVDNAKGRA